MCFVSDQGQLSGTFNEVKAHRTRLVLGWVTGRCEQGSWVCGLESVTNRYRADLKVK